MNNEKRKKLRMAVQYIDTAISNAGRIVDTVCDWENESLDNIPESLQYTDRYEAMEDAIASMESALENLDNAKDLWDSAKTDILEAISKR